MPGDTAAKLREEPEDYARFITGFYGNRLQPEPIRRLVISLMVLLEEDLSYGS
jgi:hypothetical protein